MIFKSPHPAVTIPDDISLTPYVLERAQELAEKPALIDGPGGRTLTYRQLAEATKLTAAGLAQRGFQKGDVFAIYIPNVPEYGIAFLAVALLGGINTTINPLYTVRELAFQLNDSQAKFLFTIPQFLDKAQEAAAQSGVEEIFVLGEAEGATPFAALMQNDGQVPQVDINPRQDVVVLPYSSGTTGLPKGVMLTHHNLISNIAQTLSLGHIDQDELVLGLLPFFHIYGMVVILQMALRGGATIITMPRFDLEQFLQIIQDYKISYANLVPPIILALAKHPLIDKYDLSSLNIVTSGAAPLGAELAGACAKRLNCIVLQGYGLTETSPVSHTNPKEPEKIKLGSVGPCIPNTECKIVDTASGEDLGPKQEGEVWIRGPQVMQGYLNNPEATAATLDSEGWLHTGDIGYVDDDDHFYIVDRVKELIKYKGMQVAPAELEAILLTHPAIGDAAVIPSPDEEAGEIPKAFVVLRDEISPEAIMTFVAEQVAPHKKIRKLEIIDQIPKSASGKILRRVLVDHERAGSRG